MTKNRLFCSTMWIMACMSSSGVLAAPLAGIQINGPSSIASGPISPMIQYTATAIYSDGTQNPVGLLVWSANTCSPFSCTPIAPYTGASFNINLGGFSCLYLTASYTELGITKENMLAISTSGPAGTACTLTTSRPDYTASFAAQTGILTIPRLSIVSPLGTLYYTVELQLAPLSNPMSFTLKSVTPTN